MSDNLRPIDVKRLRRSIIDRLGDLPRQLASLETSVEPFGDDFDAGAFAGAFDSPRPEHYNQAQTVERAFGHVQNHIAALAADGVRLARLPRQTPNDNEPRAQADLEALRDAAVISKSTCSALVVLQKTRNQLEHSYVRVAAKDVHRAVQRLREVAPDFARSYAAWISPFIHAS